MSSGPEPSGCFAPVVWFMFGPMALLILAIMIAEKRQGWTVAATVAFLVILVVTVCARWIDFRGGNAMTAEGHPASADDVRRFTLVSTLIGMAVWTAANMIGQR